MNPRLITMATLCREAAIPASVLVWLVAFGPAGIDKTAATPIVDHLAPLLAADVKSADIVPLIKPAPVAISTSEAVTASRSAIEPAIADPAPTPSRAEPIVTAALTDSSETLQPQTTPAPAAETSMAIPEPANQPANPAVGSLEVLDECLAVDPCVDRYLWALYQRTPKEDSIKTQEKRAVTVKRKGRMVSVTRTFTKLTDQDFSWKDPKAAENVGMPMVDYVIGGMDRDFKLKLFHMLHAAEGAGLSPGITSAFRDDYRQSIASGLKAADNRSYHGGSLRGGYGHGLAADVVSVNGATRAQRWASTEIFWKWIDAHGKEFGIARPYLGKDPPHVGPIDGKEYADHRLGKKAKPTKLAAKPHNQLASRAGSAAKPARIASSRASL